MAGMTSLLADERLFQVLKEIDVIPQLYEEFVISNERTVVSLPFTNYSRSFSFHFLAFTSEFYCGLLRQSLPERACSVCSERHGQNHLCLPNFVHTTAAPRPIPWPCPCQVWWLQLACRPSQSDQGNCWSLQQVTLAISH